jgi:hypothetical protein
MGTDALCYVELPEGTNLLEFGEALPEGIWLEEVDRLCARCEAVLGDNDDWAPRGATHWVDGLGRWYDTPRHVHTMMVLYQQRARRVWYGHDCHDKPRAPNLMTPGGLAELVRGYCA